MNKQENHSQKINEQTENTNINQTSNKHNSQTKQQRNKYQIN